MNYFLPAHGIAFKIISVGRKQWQSHLVGAGRVSAGLLALRFLIQIFSRVRPSNFIFFVFGLFLLLHLPKVASSD